MESILSREKSTSAGSSEMIARLKEFVEYFVKEMETKLQIYRMISKREMKKPMNDTLARKVGEGILWASGGCLAYFLGLPHSFGSKIGVKIGEKVDDILRREIGKEHYVKKLMNLSELMDYSEREKTDFRAELVEAAYDIFQSFEMQFNRVTEEFGLKAAMHILANDATNRVINYMGCGRNEFVSSLSVAVIKGGSKIQPVFNVPVPTPRLKSPGFKIRYEYLANKMDWNTASLYEKTGILNDNYYRKIDGTCKTGKYGYRRLLVSEDWDKMKTKYALDNIVESESGQFADFPYTLPRENSEQKSLHIRTLLEHVNSKDKGLGEERTKEIIMEKTSEILNEVIGLKKKCEESHESEYRMLEAIQKNLETLKPDEYLKTFLKNLEESKLHIIQYMEKGQEENREAFSRMEKSDGKISEGIAQINQKLDCMTIEKLCRTQLKDPVWYNVRREVKLFTGREKELKDLHEKAQRDKDGTVVSQITVISGLGGIGKTQLATKYARQHTEDYDGNVVWVDAKNCETLKRCFYDIAGEELKIPIRDESGGQRKTEYIVTDVYRHFGEVKSLFIFDDVEDSDVVDSFLPHALHAKLHMPSIIFTSRTREWEAGIEVLFLEELQFSDAVEFIMKGLGIHGEKKSPNQEVERLALKLEGFPLAIQQAIAYIADQKKMEKFSISDYLKEYIEKANVLLGFAGFKGIDNKYEKTTCTTWKITTDKISNQQYGHLALKALYFLAYYGTLDVKRSLLSDYLGVGKEEFNRSLRLLVDFSVVDTEEDQTIISIHSLVKKVIRMELKGQGGEKEVMRDLLVFLTTHTSEENFIDVSLFFLECVTEYEDLLNEFNDFLDKIFLAFSNSISNLSVLDGLHSAVEKKSILPKPSGIHTLIRNLSSTLRHFPCPEEEVKVLDYNLKTTNCNISRDYSASVKDLLRIALRQGNHNKTLLKYLDERYNQDYNASGAGGPSTSGTMKEMKLETNLGTAIQALWGMVLEAKKAMALWHRHQKRYKEALEIYQSSLCEQKNILEPNHPDILSTMENIAFALTKVGDYDKALDIYREVLRKGELIMGLYHKDVFLTMEQIASVHSQKEDYTEAMEVYKELLVRQAIYLGTNDRHTLVTLKEIWGIYCRQGNQMEGMKFLKNALRKDDVSDCVILEIFEEFSSIGESEETRSSTAQAMEFLSDQVKHCVPLIRDIMEPLPYLLSGSELFDRQAIHPGTNDRHTLVTLNEIWGILSRLGNHEEGRNFLKNMLGKFDLSDPVIREIFEVFSSIDVSKETQSSTAPVIEFLSDMVELCTPLIRDIMEPLSYLLFGRQAIQSDTNVRHTLATLKEIWGIFSRQGNHEEGINFLKNILGKFDLSHPAIREILEALSSIVVSDETQTSTAQAIQFRLDLVKRYIPLITDTLEPLLRLLSGAKHNVSDPEGGKFPDRDHSEQ